MSAKTDRKSKKAKNIPISFAQFLTAYAHKKDEFFSKKPEDFLRKKHYQTIYQNLQHISAILESKDPDNPISQEEYTKLILLFSQIRDCYQASKVVFTPFSTYETT